MFFLCLINSTINTNYTVLFFFRKIISCLSLSHTRYSLILLYFSSAQFLTSTTVLSRLPSRFLPLKIIWFCNKHTNLPFIPTETLSPNFETPCLFYQIHIYRAFTWRRWWKTNNQYQKQKQEEEGTLLDFFLDLDLFLSTLCLRRFCCVWVASGLCVYEGCSRVRRSVCGSCL